MKHDVDNVDMTRRYVAYGQGLDALAVRAHNNAPNSYDRSAVMKKGETVLRLCQVPESMVKPQELTHLQVGATRRPLNFFWVGVRLFWYSRIAQNL
jgi:hypothetical protein